MKFLIPAIFLVLLFFLSLNFLNKKENSTVNETENQTQLKIFTDKESYKQGEEIRVNVSFFSSQDLSNVEIKVSGIKSRYGDYISLNKIVDLKKGENIFEFSSRAPYCSTCTGVSPGEHELNAYVIYNSTTLASTSKNIIIES